MLYTHYTVKPPIRGQPLYKLLAPAINCPYISIARPPTKGQPPNNGQNARPQRVHYSEVSL